MKKLVFLLSMIVFPFGKSIAQDTIQLVSPKKLLKIKLGEKIAFGNQFLKFEKVIEDSRCPKGSQCFWEGQAIAIVQLFDNDSVVSDQKLIFGTKGISPKQPKAIFSTDNKTVFAYQLSPYPEQNMVIEDKMYCLDIRID